MYKAFKTGNIWKGVGGRGGEVQTKKETCADWYEYFLEHHKTEDIQCNYKVDVILGKLSKIDFLI